jgi:hypothetical protein
MRAAALRKLLHSSSDLLKTTHETPPKIRTRAVNKETHENIGLMVALSAANTHVICLSSVGRPKSGQCTVVV